MQAAAEEVADEMGTANIEIGEVRRIGLVDVVVDFEQGDVRFGNDRME